MSVKLLIADLSSLELDQTPHNRSATSPTNALISFFRTFNFPSSANLPFSGSRLAHLQDAQERHQLIFIKRQKPNQECQRRSQSVH